MYLINATQPFGDVVKSLGRRDVIYQNDAHGTSVVGGGDGVEALLACCVPGRMVVWVV